MTLKDIDDEVCRLFEISPDELRSRDQNDDTVIPRGIAILLSRDYTFTSFSKIGEFYGGRTRATVMNTIERIEELKASDKRVRGAITVLRNRLENIDKRREYKDAIMRDMQREIRRMNSGNVTHSKLALGQIVLNIETLL